MPVFTYPWALLGLAVIPALVAIYLLRSRQRRVVVSSLLLWLDHKRSREGGTRLERFQAPLLFWLEMLILLLLVLAAANPHFPVSQGARPLVVVLDDSFSMQAGGNDSARNRAVSALEEELRSRSRPSVRFIVAGERPTLLGEARSPEEAKKLLEQWRCQSPGTSLEAALSLASEIGGELSLLLVVSDLEPISQFDKGRTRWWAFGEPRGNVAITAAARSSRDGVERVLVEVANLSTRPKSVTLVLETVEPAGEVHRWSLPLEAGQSKPTVVQVPAASPALRARIDADDLPLDDRVTLLPQPVRPVRVDVNIADAPLRELVRKAVTATRNADLTDLKPEWLFTDAEPPMGEAGAWVVRLIAEKEAESYTGPFVLDRNHPVTDGLSLQGVVWAGGKEGNLEGSPVVLAGNVPLLTDSENADGRHVVRLRLRPDLSTLPESPAWPVLVSNLLQWRASARPGLDRVNGRLGEQATLTLAAVGEPLRLTAPDGTTRPLPVQDMRATARGEQVGVYEIRQGEQVHRFSVGALNRDESDLRECLSGRWGDWLDETSLRLEYRSMAGLLLLAAVGVAALHLYLVSRAAGRRGAQRGRHGSATQGVP